MFSIVANPTFVHKVDLSRPDSDQLVKVTFTFRHKGRRALAAWLGAAKDFDADAPWLHQAIEGWGSEMRDKDGAPLAYSEAALAQLLEEFPASGQEILHQYLERLQEARLGNSLRPRGR